MLGVINIRGIVVTIDTLHCQSKTQEKQAYVVVQVTNNQPKLRAAVVELFQAVFDAGKEKIATEVKEKKHGRREERYVFQLKAKLPDELAEKWPMIRSIIAVERHREVKDKGTVDTSYYISLLSPSHKLLGHYIRQHWWVESSQHYVLDIVFKEDSSRITLNDTVENIALLRRLVMNMLK